MGPTFESKISSLSLSFSRREYILNPEINWILNWMLKSKASSFDTIIYAERGVKRHRISSH